MRRYVFRSRSQYPLEAPLFLRHQGSLDTHADVAFPILRVYLICVDFIEDRPLEGSREQVVELAHRDAFAELVEIENPIAVGVVQLTAVARIS